MIDSRSADETRNRLPSCVRLNLNRENGHVMNGIDLETPVWDFGNSFGEFFIKISPNKALPQP